MPCIAVVVVVVICLILLLVALGWKNQSMALRHEASEDQPGRPRTASTKKTTERVDRYFDLIEKIRVEKGKRGFRQLLRFCEESLHLIPALVDEEKSQYGKFNIASIPAIEIGLKYWAAIGDLGRIQTIERMIDTLPELVPWEQEVRAAYSNTEFSKGILAFVGEHPGTRQSRLGKTIGISGQTVRWLVYYLEKTGRLRRKKKGNTYELYLRRERMVSGLGYGAETALACIRRRRFLCWLTNTLT